MFTPKSLQKTLLDAEFLLPELKRKRLENTWAAVFRDEILPVLINIEPEFAHKYHKTLGAPNKSVAVLLGLNILQDMFDMSDGETVEAFDFNVLWHVALQTPPDQAHVCIKTMFNFRQFLTTDELARKVFEKATDQFCKKFNVRTTHQRLDSTHVLSNMARLSRLGNFVKTIEQFLNKLSRKKPEAFAALPEPLRERYLKRDGYFSNIKGSKARRRTEQCAEDVYFLIERFRKCKTISRLESYKTLARLFDEQCRVETPEEDSKIVVLKEPKEVSSHSLQNPSDPDATYSGHKGQGYQAQIIETCHEDNDMELITCVETEGAHESDKNAPERIHENLIERGHAIEKTFVDPGYVSGKNIVKSEAQSVDLHGPLEIGSKPDEETVPLSDFQFNAERTRVAKCPAGYEPVKQKDCKSQPPATIAHFDKDICEQCDLKETCRTKKQARFRVLRFSRMDVAVAERRVRQETKEFKEAYKIRSGIEATNGHLKTDRGLRRLRVRGSPAVSLRVTFKCLAENCHRVVNYIQKEAQKLRIQAITG